MMPEQDAKPPRVHLVSCLYFVTGLLVIYLICLRLYLPPSIPYHSPPDVTLSVKPYVYTQFFWVFLGCIFCLAVSYWERYLFLTMVTGFLGITITVLSLVIFFLDAEWGIKGNINFSLREKHDILARVIMDLSYYPLRYGIAILIMIMLLRLFDYRPTTFRLTLLDVMLITIAAAVILGTRGIAMKVYAFS